MFCHHPLPFPFEKGNIIFPPFEKGGLGGILREIHKAPESRIGPQFKM
jgi:hypothetical protein